MKICQKICDHIDELSTDDLILVLTAMKDQNFVYFKFLPAFEKRLLNPNDYTYEQINRMLDFYLVYPMIDYVRYFFVDFFNEEPDLNID